MRFLSYNSQISIIVVIILLFSGFAWRDNKSAVQAATADELRNKIENSQSEIQKLEKEIQTFRQEITKTQQEKNSLNTEIKKIDLTRQKLGSEIKLTQNQIKTTEKQIAELANGIQDKETAIEHNRAVIAESMRLLAGTDDESLLVSFLASESLSEFWNSADQLAQVNNRLIKLIAELTASGNVCP